MVLQITSNAPSYLLYSKYSKLLTVLQVTPNAQSYFQCPKLLHSTVTILQITHSTPCSAPSYSLYSQYSRLLPVVQITHSTPNYNKILTGPQLLHLTQYSQSPPIVLAPLYVCPALSLTGSTVPVVLCLTACPLLLSASVPACLPGSSHCSPSALYHSMPTTSV